MRSEAPEVKEAIAGIAQAQEAVTNQLLRRNAKAAAEEQALTDNVITHALTAWRAASP